MPSGDVNAAARVSDHADTIRRWEAVTMSERERFMDYGLRPAPGESPPDYAARILKFDRKITLANSRKLVAVFRAAYDSMVGL